jgi:hypothetical protein
MKRLIVAVAVLIGMASPAFAKHCPLDAKIIDEALGKTTGLTTVQMTNVKDLRDKGMAFHKDGNHADAIKALHEATKILGVEPYKM